MQKILIASLLSFCSLIWADRIYAQEESLQKMPSACQGVLDMSVKEFNIFRRSDTVRISGGRDIAAIRVTELACKYCSLKPQQDGDLKRFALVMPAIEQEVKIEPDFRITNRAVLYGAVRDEAYHLCPERLGGR